MKKLWTLLFIPCLLASCKTETFVEPGADVNPFDYVGNFENPELTIDGLDNEEQWNSEFATTPISFTYKNYLNKNTYNCSFKLYRGIKELYAFFTIEDVNILSDGNDNGNSVSNSDSVELYLDTKNDGGEKPQADDYQINLGVHGKTRILTGNGSGWSAWTGLVQYESKINGTLNDPSDVDTSYSIEMSIPYKQINITREDTIGATIGVVDKYEVGGGSTHKRWYGLTLNGAFGSPQIPDDYFDYSKNTLNVPALPTYILENDKTDYITGVNAKIASVTDNNDTFNEVNLDVSRTLTTVTTRARIESGFSEKQGICLSFDFGLNNKTSRDELTMLIRIFPSSKTIRDCFINPLGPTLGMNKKTLSVKVSDEYCYVSFDLTALKTTSGNDLITKPEQIIDIGFNATTINSELKVIKSMNVLSEETNNTNPSTWLRLFADNTAKKGISGDAYIPENDQTTYINDIDLSIDSATKNALTYSALNIDVARNDSKIVIRLSSEVDFINEHGISIYLDIGDTSRTSRDTNTIVLRFYPSQKKIKDFFTLGNNKALKQDSLKILYSTKACQVTLDYKQLQYTGTTQNLFTYEGDIGLNVSTTDSNMSVLKTILVNSKEIISTNPSTWLRLSSDNTASSGVPTDLYIEANDNTSYIQDVDLRIEGTTSGSITYQEVTTSISRVDSNIVIKASTQNAFTSTQGLAIYLDIGASNRVVRDANTVVLRLFPEKKAIQDFFTLDNGSKALKQDTLKTLYSDNVCQITIDYKKLQYKGSNDYLFTYSDDIGLSMATTNSSLGAIKLLKVDGLQVNNTNPSTWLRLFANNTTTGGLDADTYILENDKTSYIENTPIVVSSFVFESKTYEQMNVSVSRVDSLITVKAETENGFIDTHCVALYIDIGDISRTTRDANTIVLRIFPSQKRIHDFFTLGGNKAVKQDPLTILYNNNVCFISFDYKVLQHVGTSTNLYTYDGDIGFNIASGSGTAIKSSTTINGKSITAVNPSTWGRLYNDNRMVK